jgi:hypothetical protein
VVASNEATSGATETVEPAATAIVVDGTTVGPATGVVDNLETSTSIVAENGTDILTTGKPGNGHATDGEASNDTSAIADETTFASVTVELTTVDTNIATSSDNETSTEAAGLQITTIGTDYIILISNGMVCARPIFKE